MIMARGHGRRTNESCNFRRVLHVLDLTTSYSCSGLSCACSPACRGMWIVYGMQKLISSLRQRTNTEEQETGKQCNGKLTLHQDFAKLCLKSVGTTQLKARLRDFTMCSASLVLISVRETVFQGVALYHRGIFKFKRMFKMSSS